MSFSRREFLLGFGAGLLLPKNWDFYANFLARTGEPYLARPKSAEHTLYAKNFDEPEGLRLILDFDSMDASVPNFSSMTKREFINVYVPALSAEDLEYEDDLDEVVPRWYAFDHWVEAHSPDVKAFELLRYLDLGGLSERNDRGQGWIHFVDGPCPGNSSRWVNIDPLGTSVLQHKLNELGLPVQVALV
ncbi:hypothetical protein N9V98_06670 [Luminiphilus sp.]|nr:hypothetical protein [Luminiphilus sp.]MDB2365533.1 hypothetical protein [Luminiphilus sp.]